MKRCAAGWPCDGMMSGRDEQPWEILMYPPGVHPREREALGYLADGLPPTLYGVPMPMEPEKESFWMRWRDGRHDNPANRKPSVWGWMKLGENQRQRASQYQPEGFPQGADPLAGHPPAAPWWSPSRPSAVEDQWLGVGYPSQPGPVAPFYAPPSGRSHHPSLPHYGASLSRHLFPSRALRSALSKTDAPPAMEEWSGMEEDDWQREQEEWASFGEDDQDWPGAAAMEPWQPEAGPAGNRFLPEWAGEAEGEQDDFLAGWRNWWRTPPFQKPGQDSEDDGEEYHLSATLLEEAKELLSDPTRDFDDRFGQVRDPWQHPSSDKAEVGWSLLTPQEAGLQARQSSSAACLTSARPFPNPVILSMKPNGIRSGRNDWTKGGG